MSGPAVIFREIHRLRKHAQDLQEQLDRIPRQLKAQQVRVARLEQEQHDEQEAIKKLKVEVQGREKALKARYADVDKYAQLPISSKKEYDAQQAEIAAARADCRRQEDVILEGMAQVEERTALLPERDKALAGAKQELASFEKDSGARKASLAGQLAQVSAQLQKAEEQIPANLRDQYKRVVNARGADAMSAVRDRTCTACYTEITAQNYNDLAGGMFIFCKSCGRVLYLPEAMKGEGE
jgi:predicted  nucleic acid-binding Zn-ribbon protein